jgi:hypothetical protein
MQATARVLMACAVLVAAPCAAADPAESAEDQKARETLELLFGEELKRVRSTPDAADDVQLAKRLVETARKAAAEPALLALFCETACDLAADSPNGYGIALDAAELGLKHVPEKADTWTDWLIAVRQKQFKAARGDDKVKAGETLLDLLIGRGEGCIAALDLPEASAPYRRAALAARAIRSVRRPEIDGRLAWLAHATTALAEAETLKAALAKEPGDQAMRERLVRLYLVDLDRPAEAAAFVEGVQDASLAKYVPGAAKDLAAAPELACLELAEWYAGLAEAAPTAAREPLYERAERYLLRFLDISDVKSLAWLKGKALLGRIEAARDRDFPQRWVGLLPRVDPKRHAIHGQWERRGTALASVRPVPQSEITIPSILRGAYDVRVQFVRTSGNNGLGIALPTGASQVQLVLSGGNGDHHGLHAVRGRPVRANETTVRPGTLENNRPHDLLVRIRLKDGQAAIRAALDGKEFLRWGGPQKALSLSRWSRFKRKDTPGLVTYRVMVVFSRVEVRTHSCRPTEE